MFVRSIAAAIGVVLMFAGTAYAEASLEQALDLDMDQARTVKQIEAKYRNEFRVVRGELVDKLRHQRAARVAKDSDGVAALEPEIQPLRAKLKAIRMREYDAIRVVLTDEQREKYEEVLERRHSVRGRSRDDKLWLD